MEASRFATPQPPRTLKPPKTAGCRRSRRPKAPDQLRTSRAGELSRTGPPRTAAGRCRPVRLAPGRFRVSGFVRNNVTTHTERRHMANAEKVAAVAELTE